MIEHPSGYGYLPEPAAPADDRTPLPSERVIVAAPMSFAGSAQRIRLLTRYGPTGGGLDAGLLKLLLYTGVILGIVIAWTVVLAWYFMFGLLLVPYRIIRRGQRKRRRDELRHREMLNAIERRQR
jgi:hypothetical protein